MNQWTDVFLRGAMHIAGRTQIQQGCQNIGKDILEEAPSSILSREMSHLMFLFFSFCRSSCCQWLSELWSMLFAFFLAVYEFLETCGHRLPARHLPFTIGMLLVSSSGSCRYCFKEGLVDISSGSSMFRCISSFQAFSDGGCVLALRAYMRYCACDVFFVGVSPLASLAVRVH